MRRAPFPIHVQLKAVVLDGTRRRNRIGRGEELPAIGINKGVVMSSLRFWLMLAVLLWPTGSAFGQINGFTSIGGGANQFTQNNNETTGTVSFSHPFLFVLNTYTATLSLYFLPGRFAIFTL